MKYTLFKGLQTIIRSNFIAPQSKGRWLIFQKVYQTKIFIKSMVCLFFFKFLKRKRKMVPNQYSAKREGFNSKFEVRNNSNQLTLGVLKKPRWGGRGEEGIVPIVHFKITCYQSMSSHMPYSNLIKFQLNQSHSHHQLLEKQPTSNGSIFLTETLQWSPPQSSLNFIQLQILASHKMGSICK